MVNISAIGKSTSTTEAVVAAVAAVAFALWSVTLKANNERNMQFVQESKSGQSNEVLLLRLL